MTRDQKIALLKQWQAQYDSNELACAALRKAMGDIAESPVFNAIWGSFDRYTEQVAARIGDIETPNDPNKTTWMNWFCFDNDMGSRGLEAGIHGGEQHAIKTLADLLWIIEAAA